MSAWKALETYFAISAERIVVVTNGASTEAYSVRRADTAASSAAPTSVSGGCAKSRSEEPSRMNSGLTARPSQPSSARPAPRAMAGARRVSVVPGRTVLRSTTV